MSGKFPIVFDLFTMDLNISRAHCVEGIAPIENLP